MMKLGIKLLVIVCFSLYSWAEIKNPDKPAKGEFEIKLQKVWEMDSPGEYSFSIIWHIEVSDEGIIYLTDEKNLKFYMISKNGKFVRAFGKKGEGPGEIMQLFRAHVYPVKDKLIIPDAGGRYHFFHKGGSFIKRERIKNFTTRLCTHVFLNENEFINAPKAFTSYDSGKIVYYNFLTKEKKIIGQFVPFEGGVFKRGDFKWGVVIKGISPMFVLGSDGEKLYYGRNDYYQITQMDLSDKILNRFSLDRKKERCPDSLRKKLYRKDTPPKVMKEMLSTIPDEYTYFEHIDVQDSHIWVYKSYLSIIRKNIQEIDIFSPEGKYLYHTSFKIDEGLKISTYLIKNGYLYLAWEDEQGETKLSKYKVTFPWEYSGMNRRGLYQFLEF